jgi:hypothetical protein
MLYGTVGLTVVAVLAGRMVRCAICYTPSMICLPSYINFLTVFGSYLGGSAGYELVVQG